MIAGDGSGKTRVLVYRVAYLVEKGIHPDEILLLTFTRRAAEEMLRRASGLLDDRCLKVSGGTFHSFANMILRRYAQFLGIANAFTILDQTDAEDTISLIRTNLGYHKMEKRFPRKGAILEVISKGVNKVCDIDEVLAAEYPQFMEWSQEIKKIRAEYSRYKHQKSLLDYDDLLVYLKNLLSTREDVRAHLSRTYKYIMVDEYQDTNKLQSYIACLLAGGHKNIMVVGDDAQSIYSFRGANFRNIIDFPRIFEGARIIRLQENYRSIQPILDLTNAIIAQAREKFDKELFTSKHGSTRPVFIDAADEHAQSRFVADKILELREEGVELGDMAVLFRSGWHSNDLEVELSRRNIPFIKYGGLKFVEAAHIKDMMAYARIAYNVSDEVNWHRALLLIPGVGPKTAQVIVQEAVRTQGVRANTPLVHKREGVRALFELLQQIEGTISPPADTLQHFLKYYEPLMKEKYDDYHKRINDLDSLLHIAARYDSMERFLADMALEPPERSIVEAGTRDRDDSRLTLSTIHSAKGLEWHTVFILYVAEGHLPSYLSLEDEEGIEEERRLLYVAATRAKENLFLLKPHVERSGRAFMNEGGIVFTQVSRFLNDGSLLRDYTDMQSASGIDDALNDVDIEDITGGGRSRDTKFLDMMKEYFRDTQEY